MKCQPEAGAGPGGTSGGGDFGLIDIPFDRLATHKLECSSSIMKAGFDGGSDAVGNCCFDKPVLDRDNGNAGLMHGWHPGGHAGHAISALPSTTVDVEQQWRWGRGWSLPEGHDLVWMWPVGDAFDGWFWWSWVRVAFFSGRGWGGVVSRVFGFWCWFVGATVAGEDCSEDGHVADEPTKWCVVEHSRSHGLRKIPA